MPLPTLQLQSAEALIEAFCEKRVPLHARSQVRLEYQIRGNSIILIERRIPWNDSDGERTSSPTAKFTFDQKRHLWKLLWHDQNGSFHNFDPPIESSRIADLIEIVGQDKTRIFWGVTIWLGRQSNC
jgi:hypothetical protein